MNNNNQYTVIKGHKFEEYKQKYLRSHNSLISLSRSEIDKFDNKFTKKYKPGKIISLKPKNILLKERIWWLIGDKYYEIPEPPSLNWFKSTKLSTKLIVLFCGLVLIAGCAVTPIYLVKHFQSQETQGSKEILNPKIYIDPTSSFPIGEDDYTKNLIISGTNIETTTINDKINYKIYLNSSAKATLYHVEEIFNVTRGGNVFMNGTDYVVSSEKAESGYVYSHTITFSSSNINQYSGKIEITPIYKQFNFAPTPEPTLDKLQFTLDNDFYTVKAKTNSIDGIVSIPSTFEGKTVKIIENNGFKDCINISEVYIPDSITNIGEYAFSNSGISYVDFEDSDANKISFGIQAFSNLQNLWYISLPKQVSKINELCFFNCTNLSIVNLSRIYASTIEELPALNSTAFKDCFSLKSIYVWDNAIKTILSSAEGWRDLSQYYINVI